MAKIKEKFDGYKVVIGCFIILGVTAGGPGIVGAYLPIFSKDLDIPISKLSIILTIATIAAFAFSLFTSKLINKIGARWTLALGVILIALECLVTSIATNLGMLIVTAILGGAVAGLSTQVAISVQISEWFIDKKTSMIGIAFGGSGIGAAVYAFLVGILLENMDWRKSQVVMAVVFLVVGLGANILFLSSPEKKNQKPLGWKKESPITEEEDCAPTVSGVTYEVATKTSTFKLWWVGFFLISMVYSAFSSFGPTYWQANGMSPVKSTTYLGILYFLAAISIMLNGTIAEKFGAKFYITYTGIAYILAALLTILFPNTSSLITLITIVLVAISAPTNVAYPSTLTAPAFGYRDYAKIQGQLMPPMFLGKAVVPIIIGQADALTGTLKTAYVIMIIFVCIAMALIYAGLAKSPMVQMKKTNTSLEEQA